MILKSVSKGVLNRDTNELEETITENTFYGATDTVSTYLASSQGNELNVGDFAIMIPSYDIDGVSIKPDTNDIIVVDGSEYAIIAIETFYPQSEEVAFNVFVRLKSNV